MPVPISLPTIMISVIHRMNETDHSLSYGFSTDDYSAYVNRHRPMYVNTIPSAAEPNTDTVTDEIVFPCGDKLYQV